MEIHTRQVLLKQFDSVQITSGPQFKPQTVNRFEYSNEGLNTKLRRDHKAKYRLTKNYNYNLNSEGGTNVNYTPNPITAVEMQVIGNNQVYAPNHLFKC